MTLTDVDRNWVSSILGTIQIQKEKQCHPEVSCLMTKNACHLSEALHVQSHGRNPFGK